MNLAQIPPDGGRDRHGRGFGDGALQPVTQSVFFETLEPQAAGSVTATIGAGAIAGLWQARDAVRIQCSALVKRPATYTFFAMRGHASLA
jgi:hypothetical protein